MTVFRDMTPKQAARLLSFGVRPQKGTRMAKAKKRPAHELPVPPAAEADERAVEMLRVWIADGGLHCALNIGHWERHRGVEEDVAWGMVLADAVRHIANALRAEHGTDPAETVRRVFKALEGELTEPTTRHRGRFVGGRRRPPE